MGGHCVCSLNRIVSQRQFIEVPIMVSGALICLSVAPEDITYIKVLSNSHLRDTTNTRALLKPIDHPASLGVSQVMRKRVADMITSNTLRLQGRTRYVAGDHISNTLSHRSWIQYFSLSFFLDFSTFVSSKAFLPSDVSVFFATHK